MSRITIPATVANLKRSLSGLDGIVTAKEWERAAIVWAFTYDTGGGRPKVADNRHFPEQMTISSFTALGIAGLRTRESVRFYRAQWERAMQHDARDVNPGDSVTLPKLEWKPPVDLPGDRGRRFVERTPEAVARSMDRRELDAEAFADNLSDDAAEAVVARIVETRPDLGRAHRPLVDPDAIVEQTRRDVRSRASRQVDVDLATSHLYAAAREVAEALIAFEQYELGNSVEFHRALSRVRAYLNDLERIHDAPHLAHDWSSADKRFLAEMGVRV